MDTPNLRFDKTTKDNLFRGNVFAPYSFRCAKRTIGINEMMQLHPNTTLKDAGITPQRLADSDVVSSYYPFKGKSQSFSDIIYSNETWIVRGDATMESKGRNSYQIDGEEVFDGSEHTSPLHNFWPYHVCQKTWVNRKDFCNAYAIAYLHRSMMKASADMLADENTQTNNLPTHMENQNDRPPLTTITTSGVYRLRLTAPKLDRIKSYEDGTCSAKLFFIDEQGNCFSKSYGTKYAGSLALLVGRLSGTYAQEIRADATPAEFQQYVSPAVGKPTDISVEVTPNGEWNGKPQFKYKLTFAKGSQKPAAPKPSNDEGVPF